MRVFPLDAHPMQPTVYLTLGFLLLYGSLIAYIRAVCWKDPTSAFFQVRRAHVSTYSAHRLQEATEYVNHLMAEYQSGDENHAQASVSVPELCIGIPSLQRHGISYLKSALGSLQQGLSPEERASLHFLVFLAHVNQEEHSDHGEPWLSAMTDSLPSYQDHSRRLRAIKDIERKHSHGIKAKFDYSVVLEECLKTGAPYILVAEDDVVFMRGWLPRTMQALDEAAGKTRQMGHENFLYLRLFYYEGLLGWNAESWPTYFLYSLTIVCGVLMSLLLARRSLSVRARGHLFSRNTIILVTFVFTPLLIALFFATGRNSIFPQPTGVHLMPSHGCCAQGIVFQRATVENELLGLFKEKRWVKRAADSIMERYADATGALRWALTPVVLQHVGGTSSHGIVRDKYGVMAPDRIWNYRFEENEYEEAH